MNVEEFKSQARMTLEQALNQLQTITLLIAELETQVSEVGGTLKTFARTIEQLTEQASEVPQQTSLKTVSEADLSDQKQELDK